ncbi:MAG: MFS transporter [Chitinivibrionales bacterium]
MTIDSDNTLLLPLAPTLVKFKLSAVLFLLFCSMGALTPIMSLYLTSHLGFSGTQTGFILSFSAAASFVVPVIGAIVADRAVSSERLFTILAFICSGAILMMAHVRSFIPFAATYLLYIVVNGPLANLSNTIIFHHSPNRRKGYGGIRVWGTVGWMAVAWIILLSGVKTGSQTNSLTVVFYFAAAFAAILGLASFSIPVTISKDQRKRIELFPRDSLNVIRRPEIMLLMGLGMMNFILDRFFLFGASPFLEQIGVQEKMILPMMTLGQALEIPAMFLLGYIISRWGIRTILITGAVTNMCRYLLLMNADTEFLAGAGILFHGPSYTFLFATAFIFLDSRVNRFSRAGVHQIYGLVTGGIGTFLGNILAGVTADMVTDGAGVVNFQRFWKGAFGGSVLVLVFILLTFRYTMPADD